MFQFLLLRKKKKKLKWEIFHFENLATRMTFLEKNNFCTSAECSNSFDSAKVKKKIRVENFPLLKKHTGVTSTKDFLVKNKFNEKIYVK